MTVIEYIGRRMKGSYGVSWERDLFIPLITVLLMVVMNCSGGVEVLLSDALMELHICCYNEIAWEPDTSYVSSHRSRSAGH
jgi:hypothetical protein